jgi:hypothetical protein
LNSKSVLGTTEKTETGVRSRRHGRKEKGERMKNKVSIFVARILWLWMTGRWVKLAGFDVREVDPLLRPIDQAIKQHFDLLDKWDHQQRKEIICAIINREWPGTHIHANPRKKTA